MGSLPPTGLSSKTQLQGQTHPDQIAHFHYCTLFNISGPYLTAVDLADIATQLDEDERERMAEGDVTSQDYQEFLKVLPYS